MKQLSAVSYQLSEKLQEHGANIQEVAKLNNCRPEEIIDFSSSINPLGPSRAAELAIVENLGAIANYPQESDDLYRALANYLGTKQNNLFIDNGSVALTYKLFSFLNLKNVTIIRPTFSEYERAARAFGCNVAVSHQTPQPPNPPTTSKAIFTCNPNNPTGELLDKKIIVDLAQQAAADNAFLIVDEAFMDFVNDKEKFSVKSLVEELLNLIVIGSLTKFFALAGLRLGYLCANEQLIDQIKSKNPPWLINVLAKEAAIASLTDLSYIEKTKTAIPLLRNNLIQELSSIDEVEIFPSEVNFLLVKIKSQLTSTELYPKLIKRKILIRDCASFDMGSQYIRLAVKTASQHQQLATHLKKIFKDFSL